VPFGLTSEQMKVSDASEFALRVAP